MIELLQELYDILREQQSPVVSLLNPGLSREDIERSLQGYPFVLTEELMQLYQWRNGCHLDETLTIDSLSLFPSAIFLPLDEALQMYAILATLEADRENVYGFSNRWKSNYFPVFSNGGGDYMVVECSEQRVEKGNVLYYGVGLPVEELSALYSSIENLLRTQLACYREGVVYYSNDEFITTDDDREHDIYERINSDVVQR